MWFKEDNNSIQSLFIQLVQRLSNLKQPDELGDSYQDGDDAVERQPLDLHTSRSSESSNTVTAGSGMSRNDQREGEGEAASVGALRQNDEEEMEPPPPLVGLKIGSAGY